MGKIRGGVVGECKKEFEAGIFAMLESSIKLAKGTVESPVNDVQVEHVFFQEGRLTKGYTIVVVYQQFGRVKRERNSKDCEFIRE